ncbi:MAG: proton-conducting transporter membrane subunit [Bdellovibrionia bacterium]
MTNRSQQRFIQWINRVLFFYCMGAFLVVIWNMSHEPTTFHLMTESLFQTSFSPLKSPFLAHLFGFSLRIDTVSSVMLLMITLLGALIGQYSIRYLDGEKRQADFYRSLFWIITSSAILVTSNHLGLFFLAWLGASLSLHQLLKYNAHRPQALLAARKKFIISRLGDLSLLGAIGLTYHLFGTLDIQELFYQASLIPEGTEPSQLIHVIGFLVALGAMTKSAQFPFHFWLPETMESPTPVSALMHAGIINAGGFLIIRLSPILEHATAAHLLLTVVGSTTAVYGALVMITQNQLKNKLAYSTISQMGMMLFACGLGAYSIALLHIIAHSFYKAHAFLSTGMQVEESKKQSLQHGAPSAAFLSSVSSLGLLGVIAGLFYQDGLYLPYATYGSILFLGLSQNLRSAWNNHKQNSTNSLNLKQQWTGAQSAFWLAASMAMFLSLESAFAQRIKFLVADIHEPLSFSSPVTLLCFYAYFIFCFGFWLTAYLVQPQSTRMKKLYFYLWNGGYFSAISTALVNSWQKGSHSKTLTMGQPILTSENGNA